MPKYRPIINGEDWSDRLPIESSFRIREQEGGLLDTLQAEFYSSDAGLGLTPGWEFILEDYDDSTVRYFGGLITDIVQRPAGAGLYYSVQCQDWKLILDRNFFTRSFTQKTHKEIIEGALAEIGITEFSTNLVEQGPSPVPLFNAQSYSMRQVLNQLSDLSGYVWDVTPFKGLVYRPPEAMLAPFHLDSRGIGDTSRFYSATRTLTMREYNSVEVRGSFELGTAQDVYGNSGAISEFILLKDGIVSSRQYHNIIRGTDTSNDDIPDIEVNEGTADVPRWVSKSVGIEGSSIAETSDITWNPLLSRIKFRTMPPRFSDNSWRIKGRYSARVIATVSDTEEIAAANGRIFKKLIYDRDIITRDQARRVGEAFLAGQASKDIIQCRFDRDGVQVGDAIKVTDKQFGVDKLYQVHSLGIRLLGEQAAEYEANLGNGPPRAEELAELLRDINEKANKDALAADTGETFITIRQQLAEAMNIIPSNTITLTANATTPYRYRTTAATNTIQYGFWRYTN